MDPETEETIENQKLAINNLIWMYAEGELTLNECELKANEMLILLRAKPIKEV